MEVEEILDESSIPAPPAAPSSASAPPAARPVAKRARTKRQRITPCGAPTAHRLSVAAKRVFKRPAAFFPSPTGRVCAFCAVPGNQRECEGRLFGPFRLPAKGAAPSRTFFAHRNCAVWAPEVWEAERTSRLMNVHVAFIRARRMKCVVCHGMGASLSCMYQSTACCKPMHFRCALLAGATLREGFLTLCHIHSRRVEEEKPSQTQSPEVFLEKTPLPPKLLEVGSGCTLCDGDTYDTARGNILTCSNCNLRQHSKCIWPSIEKDALFAAISYRGEFLCKDCMRCVKCEKSIDHDVYNFDPSTLLATANSSMDSPDMRDPDCNTIICLSCNHFAIHIDCLPEGSSPSSWRCDSCLICRHCDAFNVPRDEWVEHYEGCQGCATTIEDGGVVCPVCKKVYREGENIPMVQCDYCDKWLHAIECCGMSKDKFKELHESENKKLKYRCPICTEEKKKHEQERKRLKQGASRDLGTSHGIQNLKQCVDVPAFVKRILSKDPDVAFRSVRKIAVGKDTFEQVFREFALGTEVCRLCCSSAETVDLMFCADCGECYHGFCADFTMSHSIIKSKKRSAGMANDKGQKCGELGVESGPWRCVQCENFTNSTKHVPSAAVDSLGKLESVLHSAEQRNGKIEELIPYKRTNGMNGVNGLNNGNGTVFAEDGHAHGTGNGFPTMRPNVRREAFIWEDERTCELCGKGESHSTLHGRLIPWASSTISDVSHSWIHIACAMWSRGVSVHGSYDHFDVLLGSRRSVLGMAKRTKCLACNNFGASLVCSARGCTEAYHFGCATAIQAGCFVKYVNRTMQRTMRMNQLDAIGDEEVNLINVGTLHFLCPTHTAVEDLSMHIRPLSDVQRLINIRRIVMIHDIHGFTRDLEPPRRKPLSTDRVASLRMGSLSVLRFGQLVPEVNDFIIKGCLVPIGYCSARRFWSMVNPGQRCVYFFEVCGFVESGPIFVIRCVDCVDEKIESKDPDEAWARVTARVMKVRRAAGMKHAWFHAFRTTGLEAFGLKKCIPVVAHIESLPMAAMFSGRYDLKRVAHHRNDDIKFYNALAKTYRPVAASENPTGSARSEGYVAKRWIEKRFANCTKPLPSYEAVKSGSSFQLEVVREVFGHASLRAPLRHSKKLLAERLGGLQNATVNQVPTTIEERSRTSKATSSSPHVSQHRSIATSSKARTVILRSGIEGRGVFATEDIPAGEMIIEYVGEIIRPSMSDLRETQYGDRGIGCYMFQVEPGVIVDATMTGNAARFINHSCAPNCFSKTISVENDRRVIVIFAKRNIQRGEELSYDYQFPFDESDKVECGCGTPQCRGWMN